MTKPWTNWTDAELVDEAQTGLRGQGAVVEALRRHRQALVEQQRSTNRLTGALIVFALVTVALMVVQIVIVVM